MGIVCHPKYYHQRFAGNKNNNKNIIVKNSFKMASPPRINKNINNNNNNNSDEPHIVTPKRKLERPSLLTTKEKQPKELTFRKTSVDNLSSSSKSSPMRSRAST